MKYIFYLIFLFLAGSFFLFPWIWKNTPYINTVVYKSACDKPILYSIGSIDSRFGLSKDEVLQVSKRAASIWNRAVNKNLFVFDSKAGLTINMYYDERQYLTSQADNLGNTVESSQKTIDSGMEKFRSESAAFEKRLQAYNKDVEYWNNRGGAPQDKFDSLNNEQQELQGEADRLRQEAERLNISENQYNEQVDTLNKTIRLLQTTLAVKPEEGIFDPKTNSISIFFNNNQQELTRTIAHELGHARGLEHSSEQSAIMYPKTTDSLTPSKDEIASLIEICRLRPFTDFLPLYLEEYFTRPADKN